MEQMDQKRFSYGYGSIPINTIFRGINIHLPAILMSPGVQGFDPLPYGLDEFLKLRDMSG